MSREPQEITRVLADWASQDPEALAQLLPIVFEELRRLARRHFARERTGHTLQPTAVVHEVYLRLVGSKIRGFASRAHFFGFASRLMREILVDHARARGRRKRGGDLVWESFDGTCEIAAEGVDLDLLLILDEALRRLETANRRQCRITELRYFGGLTLPEVAEALDVSLATVERDWRVARRWLARELGGRAAGSQR